MADELRPDPLAIAGINHITIPSDDVNRLALFCEDVFGAPKVLDLPVPEPDGPGRHALIALGASAALHVFELDKQQAPAPTPMFSRGRIHHFALHVNNPETFEQLRTVRWRPLEIDTAPATDDELVRRRVHTRSSLGCLPNGDSFAVS